MYLLQCLLNGEQYWNETATCFNTFRFRLLQLHNIYSAIIFFIYTYTYVLILNE